MARHPETLPRYNITQTTNTMKTVYVEPSSELYSLQLEGSMLNSVASVESMNNYTGSWEEEE